MDIDCRKRSPVCAHDQCLCYVQGLVAHDRPIRGVKAVYVQCIATIITTTTTTTTSTIIIIISLGSCQLLGATAISCAK